VNIALDYDGTFTADPKFWRSFIRMARASGHTVRIVTMRHPSTDEAIPDEHAYLVGDVVYTGRRAKVDFCKAQGIDVDVWIDDSPHWLVFDG
jgi:SH3-like domain-containing protein